jgi:hypothetical protein
MDVGEELAKPARLSLWGDDSLYSLRDWYSGGDGYPGMCRPHVGTANI